MNYSKIKANYKEKKRKTFLASTLMYLSTTIQTQALKV